MRIEGVLAAGVACAMLASCGGGGDPASPREPAPAPAGADLPAYSVAEALAQVPLEVKSADAPFTVTTASLREASEAAAVDLPTDLAGVPAWLVALTGGHDAVYVPLEVPLAPSAPAAMVADDLQWSVLDVDRFLTWTSRGEATTVVAGAFDEETLAGLPSEDGVYSAGEGDDLEGSLEHASPARPQGEPLRMAVADSWLLASPRTEIAREWVDGGVPTLQDDPVLAGLADVLDRADVHAARFSTPTSWDPSQLPDAVVEALGLTSGSFPEFDAYAIGWTVVDGEAVNVVAYHDSDGRALAETQRRVTAIWQGASLRGSRPWSDYMTLLGVDVDEEHVVVRLAPVDPTFMEQVERVQDAPLLVW